MTEVTKSGSRTGSVFSHMALMIGGTGASQIVTAVAAPALTRIYSPSDFGIFAVALAIFNVLSAIVTLRYDMAIVLARSERSAANVVALCVMLAMTMTFVAVLLCVGIWILPHFVGGEGLQWWAIVLIPLGVLLFGVQNIIRLWCIRCQNFLTLSKMVLVQTVVTLGVQIGSGLLFGTSPMFLMLGTVLGLAAMVATAGPFLMKTSTATLTKGVNFSRIVAVAKRHRRFPLYAMPYNFLDQVLLRFVLMILAAFVSTATLGQFALAQRVVFLPIAVLTSSMSQIFYSRAVHNLGDPRLQVFVLRIVVAGALCMGPFIAFNFVFGEQLFQFVFGARWAEAGHFAAYLGIASFFLTLTSWLDRVYDIHGRQKTALALQACYDVVALSALAGAMHYTHMPVIGAASYAFSTAGFYVIWTYAVARIAKFPTRFFGSYIVSIAVVVAVSLIAASVSSVLSGSIILKMLYFILLSTPILLLGAIIGRNGMKQRPTDLMFTQL